MSFSVRRNAKRGLSPTFTMISGKWTQLTGKSGKGVKNNPIDLNFHLQKSWKKSTDKILSNKDKGIKNALYRAREG